MNNADRKKGLIAAVALFLLLVISFNFMPRIGAYGNTADDKIIAKTIETIGETPETFETETIKIFNETTGIYEVAGYDDLVGIYDATDLGATECDVAAANQLYDKKEKDTSTLRYNAASALLMDYNTGEILQNQNADERRPIASMVKIMTLILVFEEINKGNLSVDQQIIVSENAASMGGSQAFLQNMSKYAAGELIKSIVVASANDSCVAMAEHIAGSVEAFVVRMNEKATALGLTNTYFVNCTGLPAPNQYSTAVDVAVMFRELISHEQFFEYAKIWMYDFAHPDGRVTSLTNTNKLVRFYNGCDGGKTGFTSEALSCLAATAKRGDTRLISVIVAAPSSKERNAEVSKMLNYGFANYETRQLVFKGLPIDEKAAVGRGKENNVTIAPASDYFRLIKKGEKTELQITPEINQINAPVSKGDVAGKINVLINGEKVGEVNLIAMSDIGRASYLDFINKLIKEW